MSNAAGAFCQSGNGGAFVELPSNTGRACASEWWVGTYNTLRPPDDFDHVTRYRGLTNSVIWNVDDEVPDPCRTVYVNDSGETLTGGFYSPGAADPVTDSVFRFNKDGTLASSFAVTSGRDVRVVGRASPSATDFYVVSVSTGPKAHIEKYNDSNAQQWDTGMLSGANVKSPFQYSMSLAFDSNGDPHVVIIDTSNVPYILKFNATTGSETTVASGSAFQDVGDTQYPVPFSLAIDSSDNIYVLGTAPAGASWSAFKFNSSGVLQWGQENSGYVCLVDASDRLFSGSITVSRMLGIDTSDGSTLWTHDGAVADTPTGIDYLGDRIIYCTANIGALGSSTKEVFVLDSTDGTRLSKFTTSSYTWALSTYKG